MAGVKFSGNDICFLIENYPKYGGKYCQNNLEEYRSIDCINNKARNLKLSAKGAKPHPTNQSINVNKFLNIESKEIAYFLGYFWADGYIHHYISNGIKSWRIAMEIVTTDAKTIIDIMMSIGKWSKQVRQRKHWKETTTFVTNNEYLYKFLEDNDYKSKSMSEPSKILKLIPKELQPYFWKGLIDGDGSLNVTEKGAQFEISSPIDYRYEEAIKMLKSCGIKRYGVYKRYNATKDEKTSYLKVYGKEILKLNDIMINYGLKRKYDNFIKIKNRYENKDTVM